MFNVGGGEFFVILLLALIVLGPDKLPGAMRTVGQWAGEMRKMANGFQTQMNDAMNATVDVKSAEKPAPKTAAAEKPAAATPKAADGDGAPEKPAVPDKPKPGTNGSSAANLASKTGVAPSKTDPAGDAPAAEAE